MTPSDEQNVNIDGHRLRLAHLEKVLYAETGTTKAQILDYYMRIAHVMIPHAESRPATRKRWVNGVGDDVKPGQVFFQKNIDQGAPRWIVRNEIQHSDHVNTYPQINDRVTLIWFAQRAALEFHVPQWRFGVDKTHENPDRLVLDLDPGEGAGLAECAEVARYARVLLQDMGLEPHPVTSGSKGIHLYAPLDGSADAEQISAVAHELARVLEADHPELVVSDMKKEARRGKVLIDWSQNNPNKTTIVPYSLRGRSRPTVAAPRTWDEINGSDLRHLEYEEVLERVESGLDPIAGISTGSAASNPTPLASLDDERAGTPRATTSPSHAVLDRLTVYRSKRDPEKTPEPVPAAAPDAQEGNTFVIQKHAATRLHYDFRLEHDGVLVSWALPKGLPTEPAHNRLAVQTEDHPLEYGSFEGDIPKGEYGGGHVDIWDAGTYELEKWRDDKEIIFVLHGRRGPAQRYVLIHTGSGGEKGADKNWLLHLMKDDGDWARAHDAHGTGDVPSDESAKVTGGTAAKAAGAGTSRTASAHARLAPMLATAGDAAHLDADTSWAYEMKWDGIRLLAEIVGGTVRLRTRNDHDVTASYPELGVLADLVDGDALLDGEVVALGPGNRPDFGLLQSRSGLTKKADVERARAEVPVAFFVFDVLEADGAAVVDDSYDERRALLRDLVGEDATVHVPPAFDGDLDAAIAASLELGLEGVMAKDRSAAYRSGRRSEAWIKIKHHRTQEVVIGGWRAGNGNREGTIGSLLLGIPDTGGLRYVGRVGTGFTDRALADLLARMRPLERKTMPFADVPAADARDVTWVRPALVGEVEFGEWTHGDRLRQPTWRGLRSDKDPDDVVLERG